MFGLFRLVILCAIAFLAGVLFERNDAREACEATGEWQDGLCTIKEGAQ